MRGRKKRWLICEWPEWSNSLFAGNLCLPLSASGEMMGGNMQTETLFKKKCLYHCFMFIFLLSYFLFTAVWLDWSDRNTLAIVLCVLRLEGKGGEIGSVSWVRYLSWYTYNSPGYLSSASSIAPICPFCYIFTGPSVFCICTSLHIILPVTTSVYNSRLFIY